MLLRILIPLPEAAGAKINEYKDKPYCRDTLLIR
jgi:hypothetical protein